METQFLNLCRTGDLNTLIDKFNNNNFINIAYDNAFVTACHNGNLLVAQWLFKYIDPNTIIDINIYIDINRVFSYTCVNGHLHVAQWLLEIKPSIVNSIWYDNAFRYACGNGHLLLAQFLVKIKPSIINSIYYNDAFKWACLNDHLLIGQWLQSFNPYYYIIICDEQTNKIIYYSTNKLNYGIIKTKINTVIDTKNGLSFKEALIRERFHPKHMDKWIDWGHCEADDFL